MGVGILLTCGNHFDDRIFSQRGDAWSHKTRITPLLLIEVQLPSQESEQCSYVLGVSSLPLSMTLLFEFGMVLTVWYFLFLFYSYNHKQIFSINARKITKQYILYCILELFRQCVIFCS